MNILELTALVFCGSLVAGIVGSLSGLGGAIIITPLLTLALGVDIHYAMGAALVSVIATSSGAAAAYVKEGPDYAVFHREPAEFRSVTGIVSAALSRDGGGIIQLGILLLIATPVARVVFSVFAFSIQRDWLYTLVTLIVLAVLVFSLAA